MTTATTALEIRRVGPRIGAEVIGVDLTRPVGEAAADRLRGAFEEHKVLVLPVFAIESLTYEEVPELGGHTLWADLQAAYDDLSEPFKVLLASVSAAYDADPQNYAQGKKRTAVGETVEHPVVLEHPVTGRKGLFISTSALRLTGVTPEGGQGAPRPPPPARLVAGLHHPLRLEPRRLRAPGQPGDLALRRGRLRRRRPRVPQGDRCGAPAGLSRRLMPSATRSFVRAHRCGAPYG